MTFLTLSATGSEMNVGRVISNVDTNEKYGYFAPHNDPRVSFLDPTNTFTVCAYQTASGSADIMSHIFNVAYFSTQTEIDMLLRMQETVGRELFEIETVKEYIIPFNTSEGSGAGRSGDKIKEICKSAKV